MKFKNLSGMVFDIKRFAVHDGPGIRTTVFLKGCLLSCSWCHNPEGISKKPVLLFSESLCIGCQHCLKACEHNVHIFKDNRHLLQRENCIACGKCAQVCPTQALEISGREMTVEEVISEVERDKDFYITSGGGMTLSGGEPLLQFDFAFNLLKVAKEKGLHTVVDTCGYISWKNLERILKITDLFLYDIKHMDTKKHQFLTGVSNEQILENVRKLAKEKVNLIIRFPYIPTYNDDKDNLNQMASFLKSLSKIPKVEILPYHTLGRSKRERLGVEDTLKRVPIPAAEEVENVMKIFHRYGISAKLGG